jgi:hypothetical protein
MLPASTSPTKYLNASGSLDQPTTLTVERICASAFGVRLSWHRLDGRHELIESMVGCEKWQLSLPLVDKRYRSAVFFLRNKASPHFTCFRIDVPSY